MVSIKTGMKKILFIVCMRGDESAGYKLFQDYPYGQTDEVEWSVVVGNAHALMLQIPFLESDLERSFADASSATYEGEQAHILKGVAQQYDEVFIMRSGSQIRSRSWEDYAIIPAVTEQFKNQLQPCSPKIIGVYPEHSNNSSYLGAHHSTVATLYYQKTFDVYHDYERMLVDFESIIHQDHAKMRKTKWYDIKRVVGWEEHKKYDLTDCEMVELSKEDKTSLSLSVESNYVPFFFAQSKEWYCHIGAEMKGF